MTMAAAGAGIASALGATASAAAGWGAAASAATSVAGAVGGSMLANSSRSSGSGSGSGSEKGTIKTSGFSPEIIKLIESIIAGGDYTKDAAIKDSNNAVLGAMQAVMQQQMPHIAGAERGSGMTNSSMTQLLANQTATQAAVQGGAVQMDAINKYNQNMVSLLSALAQGMPKTETRDITRTESNSQASSGGMCWITTLVCADRNLPDDCDELQVLRWYRDNWMIHNKPEQLKYYYSTKDSYSAVLETIDTEVRHTLYTMLYDTYILPAIEAVRAGDYEAALSNYTHAFNTVQETVLSVSPELSAQEETTDPDALFNEWLATQQVKSAVTYVPVPDVE